MKRLLLLASLFLVAAFAAAGAHADGDPASDILYTQDVFVPFPKPSAGLVTGLSAAVAAANKGGMKLKVAVLASEADMGTARSLFGRPADYAKFLGFELSYNYDGVLLVVMPAGFGVYKDKTSPTKYEHAVSSVNIDSASADGLMRTATSAVRRLAALGIADVDRAVPAVHAYAAHVKHGAKVELVYAVSDNSNRSREVVTVFKGTRVAATLRSPLEVAHSGTLDFVNWRAPAYPSSAYRFCVVATDPAGNKSPRSCAPIRVG